MVCEKLKNNVSKLPSGFQFRLIKESELDVWKDFPFDNKKDAVKYRPFMDDYFTKTYLPQRELFFKKCLFVVNEKDEPVATCFVWKMENKYTTIHWFKTKKNYEGRGIGKALLAKIMEEIDVCDYPIFLHTQTGCFRALKVYSDFGFSILDMPIIDNRENGYPQIMEILKCFMPTTFLSQLTIKTYNDKTNKFDYVD